MNDRILNLLGLCRRAHRLTIGNDMVIDDIQNARASLVVIASDISGNTEKKLLSKCDEFGVRCLRLNRSKDELSFALGKLCAVAAVCDEGFAKKLSELHENETGGNCL